MLTVQVYRNAHIQQDCTNRGVSSQFTQLAVANIEGPTTIKQCAERGIPLVWLQKDERGSRLVPALLDGSGPTASWTMFGGNFASCCDSRFGAATGARIVPIHDRVED